MSGYVNPYDVPAHDRHVTEGFCDAIHVTKAWCNLPAGHSGDHMAPHEDGEGRTVARLWWNDSDNHSRSAVSP